MANNQVFHFQDFEAACYSGKLDHALQQWQQFNQLLMNKLNQANVNDDYERIFIRVASALSALFCNPAVTVSDAQLKYLLSAKNQMSILYYGTAFVSSKHILDNLVTTNKQGNQRLVDKNLNNYLAVCSCESFPLDIQSFFARLPTPIIRLRLWCALLSEHFTPSQKSAAIRTKLLNAGPEILADFKQLDAMDAYVLNRMKSVFMTCSYLLDVNKHDCKRLLGRLFRQWAVAQQVSEPNFPLKRLNRDKPVLLVVSEVFNEIHAMYRCYAGKIKALKGRFKLILLTMEGDYDKASNALFDKIIAFPQDWNVRSIVQIAQKINSETPDMIYYPSIGMRLWTTILCQFRFAPIQLMTGGHPATSMSPVIDYFLSPEETIKDASLFSETMIAYNRENYEFSPRPLKKNYQIPVSTFNGQGRKIRIAIPSVILKLNYEFLRVCKSIADACPDKIEWIFFPSRSSLYCHALEIYLKKQFHCRIFSYMDYHHYMDELTQCDIQLSAFPFGNTNGFIDGISVGLPIVCMEGLEIHSQIDHSLSRVAGLPDYCRVNNQQDYIAAVVRLVTKHAERMSISERLIKDKVVKRFYERQQAPTGKDFADSFFWLYKNHKALQTDGRKLWSVKERYSNFQAGVIRR